MLPIYTQPDANFESGPKKYVGFEKTAKMFVSLSLRSKYSVQANIPSKISQSGYFYRVFKNNQKYLWDRNVIYSETY